MDLGLLWQPATVNFYYVIVNVVFVWQNKFLLLCKMKYSVTTGRHFLVIRYTADKYEPYISQSVSQSVTQAVRRACTWTMRLECYLGSAQVFSHARSVMLDLRP